MTTGWRPGILNTSARENSAAEVEKQALTHKPRMIVAGASAYPRIIDFEAFKKIADKLAYVMAGGDLSEASLVSEQYLLDLEREAFLSLCTERKTLERIQHMLKTGKPLRN